MGLEPTPESLKEFGLMAGYFSLAYDLFVRLVEVDQQMGAGKESLKDQDIERARIREDAD